MLLFISGEFLGIKLFGGRENSRRSRLIKRVVVEWDFPANPRADFILWWFSYTDFDLEATFADDRASLFTPSLVVQRAFFVPKNADFF